jgi:hypothetical protein
MDFFSPARYPRRRLPEPRPPDPRRHPSRRPSPHRFCRGIHETTRRC